ncbi:MAG: hypothetical protein EHM35_01845 [Planctomycetaceae bacterium]|nr:MAG: hypothetical protein EHM35_01845 [Planctomycetaceae bacterium]
MAAQEKRTGTLYGWAPRKEYEEVAAWAKARGLKVAQVVRAGTLFLARLNPDSVGKVVTSRDGKGDVMYAALLVSIETLWSRLADLLPREAQTVSLTTRAGASAEERHELRDLSQAEQKERRRGKRRSSGQDAG